MTIAVDLGHKATNKTKQALKHSETTLKRPLKNRQNKGLNFNTGQKYCMRFSVLKTYFVGLL